eukprot:TRINITY_DN4960_c0_g1_i2.p1 TRINITY_DN4960_c0_g1~~TRINITY_DN4960_c0_g1_i2.p1  ORF type:complete len:245 (-),score=112.28 TRINITY_DN4960_c0_g1_i2:47-781(-)
MSFVLVWVTRGGSMSSDLRSTPTTPTTTTTTTTTATTTTTSKKTTITKPKARVVVGPLPPTHSNLLEDIESDQQEKEIWKGMREAEERQKEKKPEREEWMTKLPQNRPVAVFAGARQFSKRDVGESQMDSSWTDSPQEREKKKNKKVEDITTHHAPSLQDEESLKIFEEYEAKKRGKSLMEIHQEEKKKKEREEGGEKEQIRRPFDREKDLEIKRPLDPKSTNQLFADSKMLNTKFGNSGKRFL